MGVTTIVAGNCGSSPVDIGAALKKVGRGGCRRQFRHAGRPQRGPPPGDGGCGPRPERRRADADGGGLVRQAVRDGALGFSTGLQYVPGMYAKASEIEALARTACAAGGLYASHMRNEGTRIKEALAETIRVGQAADCRVEVSHLKIDSPKSGGRARRPWPPSRPPAPAAWRSRPTSTPTPPRDPACRSGCRTGPARGARRNCAGGWPTKRPGSASGGT